MRNATAWPRRVRSPAGGACAAGCGGGVQAQPEGTSGAGSREETGAQVMCGLGRGASAAFVVLFPIMHFFFSYRPLSLYIPFLPLCCILLKSLSLPCVSTTLLMSPSIPLNKISSNHGHRMSLPLSAAFFLLPTSRCCCSFAKSFS